MLTWVETLYIKDVLSGNGKHYLCRWVSELTLNNRKGVLHTWRAVAGFRKARRADEHASQDQLAGLGPSWDKAYTHIGGRCPQDNFWKDILGSGAKKFLLYTVLSQIFLASPPVVLIKVQHVFTKPTFMRRFITWKSMKWRLRQTQLLEGDIAWYPQDNVW